MYALTDKAFCIIISMKENEKQMQCSEEQRGENMQHIIVDLEFAPIKDRDIRKELKNEVIEIGAVRLDENYEYVDSFDLLVRPEYAFVDTMIYKLTGITKSALSEAPLFDEAMDIFTDWIGTDNFRIYQWSENDRLQILHECKYKRLSEKQTGLCGKHWRDVQRIYSRVFHSYCQPSLERALDELAIEFEGHMHRACDDARNTASILQTMAVKEKYLAATEPIRKIKETQKSTSTLGELLGIDFSALLAVCEA